MATRSRRTAVASLLPTDGVLTWQLNQTPHTVTASVSQVLRAMATLPATFTSIKVGGVTLVPGPSLAQFNALDSLAKANSTTLVSLQAQATKLQTRLTALESKNVPVIAIGVIPAQKVNTPFTVSGTVGGVDVMPTLQYQTTTGSWSPLPSPKVTVKE